MQDENNHSPKVVDWKTVRCGNCQFWDEGLQLVGQCKYRAPGGSGFAMTSDSNWCGDFYPRGKFFVRKKDAS